MDKIATLKALAILQLAYPTDMSRERLDMYVNMLMDLPPNLLASAVTYCINHCRFLPSVAEPRATALANGDTDEDSAATAWGRVQKAIAFAGYTGRPDFSDDPILADVVDHLGWKQICLTPVDDTAILRAQFRKSYEAGCRKRRDVHDFSQVGICISPQFTQAVTGKTEALPEGGDVHDFS